MSKGNKKTVGEILAEIEKNKGYPLSKTSGGQIKKIYIQPRRKNTIEVLLENKIYILIIIILLIGLYSFLKA